jgi:hypothetical protein
MSRQESSGGFCSERSRGTYPGTLLEPPPRRLPVEESRSRMAVTIAVVLTPQLLGHKYGRGARAFRRAVTIVLALCRAPGPVTIP